MENKVAESRLKTMCMNWCFVQDLTYLTKFDLSDYNNLRFSLYKKLISHPLYETLVKPAYEEFKKTDCSLDAFNKCQVFVFKLMDLINREDSIKKDFV